VRTSLDPFLQLVADKALREGLVTYDRRHGWRGPVTRLPSGTGGVAALKAVPTPAGTPAGWELAAVTDVAADSARILLADGKTGTIPMPDTSGPSIPEMTATWAVRNGCDATPSETSVAADVTLVAFDCPPGADVELYRVDNGGHSWPGSEFSSKVASVIGSTTMSISANELMWDFFEAHPLRAG
jgi:polyhydroxybutyrate depolymerase